MSCFIAVATTTRQPTFNKEQQSNNNNSNQHQEWWWCCSLWHFISSLLTNSSCSFYPPALCHFHWYPLLIALTPFLYTIHPPPNLRLIFFYFSSALPLLSNRPLHSHRRMYSIVSYIIVDSFRMPLLYDFPKHQQSIELAIQLRYRHRSYCYRLLCSYYGTCIVQIERQCANICSKMCVKWLLHTQ